MVTVAIYVGQNHNYAVAADGSVFGWGLNSNGQLGTVSSSRRYKEDIAPIAEAGRLIDSLKPVSFRYKKATSNGAKPIQYGLIAEEVEQVAPELVVYSADGQVETVAYQMLIPILLSELENQREINKQQEAELERLSSLDSEIRRLRELTDALLTVQKQRAN